jgi:ABC-2 type transport system ATP-binding protein
MSTIIRVQNLVKKYKDLTAVNNISFEVKRGEIFGLLGENGAGKTTTLEMIEGLRKPTSGEVMILGHDIKKELADVKESIGVQLQSSAYYNYLTLKEILALFGSFYSKRLDPLELLEMVDLKDKANMYVNNLSGGQKQRFSIVASLVNDPEIVFLDEPTTGLDPMARRNLWGIISNIKEKGKTVILTTHYLEEAEMLCDRIAIMDSGKILMIDATHKLIENAKNPYKINLIAPNIDENTIKELENLSDLEELVGKSHHFEMKLKNQVSLNKAIKIIHKLEPESLTVGKATLEDLFIELTGRRIGGE